MGALSAVGLPALTCFSIVEHSCAFSYRCFDMQVQAVFRQYVTHYLVGRIGILFGAAVTMFPALPKWHPKKNYDRGNSVCGKS